MILEKKGKKVAIREGIFTYHITVNSSGVKCACFCKNRLCDHLLVFFDSLKIDRNLLNKYYSYLESEIGRLYGLNNNQIDYNKELKKYLRQEYRDDCGMCLSRLSAEPFSFYRCCGKGIHNSCLKRWEQSNKTCIYCRGEKKA